MTEGLTVCLCLYFASKKDGYQMCLLSLIIRNFLKSITKVTVFCFLDISNFPICYPHISLQSSVQGVYLRNTIIYYMKKALTFLSFSFGNLMIAFAQGQSPIIANQDGVAVAGTINDSAITGLIASASKIIGMIVPLLVSLAVAAFFFFLVQFIWKGKDDPKVHESGIKGMGYSVLAIFVMVSIWGIVGLFGNILGIGQGGSSPVPQVPVLRATTP